MKIIAEYDENLGLIKDKFGTDWSISSSIKFNEYEDKQDKVIELVKLGMSAEDILKLKHGGAI